MELKLCVWKQRDVLAKCVVFAAGRAAIVKYRPTTEVATTFTYRARKWEVSPTNVHKHVLKINVTDAR